MSGISKNSCLHHINWLILNQAGRSPNPEWTSAEKWCNIMLIYYFLTLRGWL
jgi:hypothetical protein